jgi:hypothetical protein
LLTIFKICNFVAQMGKRYIHTKIFAAILLLLMVDLSFGAFTTGKTDDTKDKYSLKNLNSGNKKVYSLSSLNTNSFRYSGSLDLYQQNNGNQLQVQSMIRLERGNTTYVYPYKYAVKVPKFKTPVAPTVR